MLFAFCPVDPTLEVFGGNLVTINKLACIIKIACVQVKTVVAGNKGQCFIDIGS